MKNYKVIILLSITIVLNSISVFSDVQHKNVINNGIIKLPMENLNNGNVSQFTSENKFKSNLVNEFINKNGNWTFMFDKTTNSPRISYGKPIKLIGFSEITKDNIDSAARFFINSNLDLLNLKNSSYSLVNTYKVNKLWYAKYRQNYKGLEFNLSEIDLRITNSGNLISFRANTYDNINLNITPLLDFNQASQFANKGMKSNAIVDTKKSKKELTILPICKTNTVEYHLVYTFYIDCGKISNGKFLSYVDANSGEVLWRYNTVYDATTNINVTGSVKKQNYLSKPEKVIFPYLHLKANANVLTTDSNGKASLDINVQTNMSSNFEGPWAMVSLFENTTSQVNSFLSPDISNNINFDDLNSNKFERQLFYHANIAHDFIKKLDPAFVEMDRTIYYSTDEDTTYTSDNVNAYSSGESITFVATQFPTAHMVETPMVLYHEFGHTINYFLYRKILNITDNSDNGMHSSTLQEATADINSCLMVDDPKMAIGVFEDENKLMRNLNNKLIFPDSLTGEGHHDGQILSGSFWDLREMTNDLTLARNLSHFAKYGTPDDPNVGVGFTKWLIETITADDNLYGDNDLSNGSPHILEILKSFENHRIGYSLLVSSSFVHVPHEDTQDLKNDYQIDFKLTQSFYGQNIVKDAYVYWTDDHFNTINKLLATKQLDNYSAKIPAHNKGVLIEYYIKFTSTISNSENYIIYNSKEYSIYDFLVGYQNFALETFENNPKWIVGNSQDFGPGQAWERAIPAGNDDEVLSQPSQDHTVNGKYCFGNAPTDTLFNFNQKSSLKSLVSTSYDVSTLVNPVLRFYYWYSNVNLVGTQKGSLICSISADNGKTWVLLDSIFEMNKEWSKKNYFIKNYFTTFPSSIKVKFSTYNIVVGDNNDFTNLTFTKSFIDDFQILTLDFIKSVEENNNSELTFSISPNPASDNISIGINDSYLLSNTNQIITITDYLGQVIYRTNNLVMGSNSSFKISTKEFANGNYYLSFQYDNKRVTKGFVILK